MLLKYFTYWTNLKINEIWLIKIEKQQQLLLTTAQFACICESSIYFNQMQQIKQKNNRMKLDSCCFKSKPRIFEFIQFKCLIKLTFLFCLYLHLINFQSEAYHEANCHWFQANFVLFYCWKHVEHSVFELIFTILFLIMTLITTTITIQKKSEHSRCF